MRQALSFLTPFGGATTPSRAALGWFPAVGASVGLVVGGAWWAAGRLWAAPVAAALTVAADVAVTGFLHLDGLADAADGLVPPLSSDRRLTVMADPAVGAFGVGAVVVVLLVRFGAFASTPAVPLVVAGLWCASRTAMAVTAQVVPYARPGGLASAFVDDSQRRDPWINAAVGATLSVALVVAGRGWRGVVCVAAGAIAFAVVVTFARRRIGGFTGDVLGAAGVIGETVGLLVLAARR
ncbi:MAG TPA: adenosylcobinamide-GDP ribazoletransferase [Acidimicrobiales bacterium]|nr:adenosylcobinamide-GDP ribazoletransferase [Acidimicrobiales bacterium]